MKKLAILLLLVIIQSGNLYCQLDTSTQKKGKENSVREIMNNEDLFYVKIITPSGIRFYNKDWKKEMSITGESIIFKKKNFTDTWFIEDIYFIEQKTKEEGLDVSFYLDLKCDS